MREQMSPFAMNKPRYIVSKHAGERYQERVKPALSLEQAQVELQALLNACGRELEEPQPPAWAGDGRRDRRYLEAVPGAVCAVLAPIKGDRFVVNTILVRGGMSERVRDRKRTIDREKRRRKSHRKKVGRH